MVFLYHILLEFMVNHHEPLASISHAFHQIEAGCFGILIVSLWWHGHLSCPAVKMVGAARLNLYCVIPGHRCT
jgi:hypothetical protein